MSKTTKKRRDALNKYIGKKWEVHYLNFLMKHEDKPWNCDYISRNPNITMEIIENNPENPWDWCNISQNTFKKEKELFY